MAERLLEATTLSTWHCRGNQKLKVKKKKIVQNMFGRVEFREFPLVEERIKRILRDFTTIATLHC